MMQTTPTINMVFEVMLLVYFYCKILISVHLVNFHTLKDIF